MPETIEPIPVSAADAPAAGAPSPETLPPVASPAGTAPVVVETPAVAAPAAPVEKFEKSLFEEASERQAEKAKADAAAKPVETSKPAEPVVEPKAEVVVDPAAPVELAPVAYEYKLPDTIRMDDATREEVHKAFDEFRRDPVKGAQQLVDMHAKRMAEFADQYAQHYDANMHQVWNKTRRDWRAASMGHPTLGGSGFETTMSNVAHVRDVAIAQIPEARREAFRKEFNEALHVTGFGDHPIFMEFGAALSRFFKEPEVPKMSGAPAAQPKRSLRAGFYKSK